MRDMKGKVAFLKAPKEVEIRGYELPKPGPGAMLLKVRRSNLCGSELHIWSGNHPVIKGDIVLGHETIGEILELGNGVEKDYAGNPVKIGDRIVAPYYLTCMKCKACLRGDFYLCHNAYAYWVKHPDVYPHFHGTFATHWYVHPNQYFFKVPDEVSDQIAASANCALSQVYFGIEQACLTGGEYILIIGAGGLGLNATAIAKEKGAKVIVVDAVKDRLQLAKEFGADFTIDINEYNTIEERVKKVNEITGGEGADVVLEVAGVPQAFVDGVHYARLGGRLIEIGNVSPQKTVEIGPALITRKALHVIGVVRYNPWYLYKSLQFLKENSNKYPYYKFTDKEYSLDEVQLALERAEKRLVTRAVIVP
jgi:threonine dehydrogenase-like Zn-dependent dehydrogenase